MSKVHSYTSPDNTHQNNQHANNQHANNQHANNHAMYCLGFGVYAYVSHPHGRTETQQLSAFHMCRVPSCHARVYEIIDNIHGEDVWLGEEVEVTQLSGFKQCTSRSGEHQFDQPYVPALRPTIQHAPTQQQPVPSTMVTDPHLLNQRHITAIVNPNRKDKYTVSGPYTSIITRLEAMVERGTITNWIINE